MFFKKIKLILILFLFYQTPLYSKSTSFNDFNYKSLSRYFSGVVANENNDNSEALEFFSSAKILLNEHDPYLKRYVYSLVSNNKVSKAINTIKQNIEKKNSYFFDAYLLLIVDSLKKDDLKKAQKYLLTAFNFSKEDRLNQAILESLEGYIFVFKEKKILNNKKNLGKLSIISEILQRCYLEDPKTDVYFSNLIGSTQGNFTRYVYFYLSYLIEQNRTEDAKKITDDLEFINTTLLLSQGKSWIENNNFQKFEEIFSCKNHKHIVSEFLFIISNLYSSENDFEKSNFYLSLSNFLNPDFIFNQSLVVENQFLSGEYNKTKKTLKNFKKETNFYYWYRVKKEAQIIEKLRNKNESLNYIVAEFEKIDNPNDKILFDIANFYKNSKKFEDAIKYYSKILKNYDEKAEIKYDLLYRRGGSFERIGEYSKADKDLLEALSIKPDNAYILNYLAYSWLERDHRINEAIKMLETAYAAESNDPYIIDSIGWAYYLIEDYLKAEKFLKRAVELMPNDPIVNDHYGDILWKLNRKIQARYFWKNVLEMDQTEKEMINTINEKMIEGLKNS